MMQFSIKRCTSRGPDCRQILRFHEILMIKWLHSIDEFSFDYCNKAILLRKKSPKRSVFRIFFLLWLWHHHVIPNSSWLWFHIICLIFVIKLAQCRLWKFNIIFSIYNQQKTNRCPLIFSKYPNEKRTNCENDSYADFLTRSPFSF